MKITNQQISFAKIDHPIEAFVTPPNDTLAGLLMDKLPKDSIDISGNIGDKTFGYTYSMKENKIKMHGSYDGLTFDADGILSKEVNIKGTTGENSLTSKITPQNMGPFNDSQTGEISVKEKLDFNVWTGIISVNGSIGGEELVETIKTSDDGTKILDFGNIGKWKIDREVVKTDRGFHIKGTIGDLQFEEFITAK
jgi:hypothetical protein